MTPPSTSSADDRCRADASADASADARAEGLSITLCVERERRGVWGGDGALGLDRDPEKAEWLKEARGGMRMSWPHQRPTRMLPCL